MNDIKFHLPVEEQIQILKRGVADLVSEDDLRRKLTRSIEEKKPLRVKLGADPTRPDLHLGHAVILRKMRQFQDLGHKVIMLIGDFTAIIGDPTGKSKTRPPVTLEQTRANAQSYLDQCKLILRSEPEVLELRYNSEWLEPMGYADVIRLASRYTVARIMERDDFKKRFEGGVPISMHELLYPLTQGYDSVALNADVELGGTDQLFNNLVGRALQRDYDQEPQVVMTLPLLVGLDGVEKMSKSLDNYIGLTDEPDQMFAGLMKVPDEQIENYLTLLTDLTVDQIRRILNMNHKDSHRILATLITGFLHRSVIPNIESLQIVAPDLYYAMYPDLFVDEEQAFKFINIIKESVKTLKLTNNFARDISALMSKEFFTGIDNEVFKMEEYLNDATKRLRYLLNVRDRAENEAHSLNPHVISAMLVDFGKNLSESSLLEFSRSMSSQLQYAIDGRLDEISASKRYIDSFIDNQAAMTRYQSVAKGGIPDNLPSVPVPTSKLSPDGTVTLARLMVMAGLEASLGAARRTIQGKGLKVDGQPFLDPQGAVSIPEAGIVIQKGKDKFARMMPES